MKVRNLIFLLGIVALLSVGILGCATPGPAVAPIGNATGSATGAAPGHGGDVYVTVTMANGFITHVSINANRETPAFAAPVLFTAPGLMVERNTAQIDTIASATVTSMAVIEAAQIAIDRIVAGR